MTMAMAVSFYALIIAKWWYVIYAFSENIYTKNGEEWSIKQFRMSRTVE